MPHLKAGPLPLAIHHDVANLGAENRNIEHRENRRVFCKAKARLKPPRNRSYHCLYSKCCSTCVSSLVIYCSSSTDQIPGPIFRSKQLFVLFISQIHKENPSCCQTSFPNSTFTGHHLCNLCNFTNSCRSLAQLMVSINGGTKWGYLNSWMVYFMDNSKS